VVAPKPTRPSASVENFLKAVYVLQKDSDRVSTNALAKALQVLPPSVTDMARRMAKVNLVDYQKYHGLRLTADGEALALRVIRRHRLIELYLIQELGYTLPQVHEDAERLEHAVSERFIAAIDSQLGYPTIDPHGEPIPSANGKIARRNLTPLVDLQEGARAQISRFATDNPQMLEHILDRGFTLGTEVAIITRDPFDGPLTVRVGDQERIIGYQAAAAILVEIKG